MAVRVGFGKADLWGSWGADLPLADAVEVTAFAADNGGEDIALLLVADVCGMWPSTCERLRDATARRTGTARDRVAVYCTQNHGAPMEGPGVYDLDLWERRFCEAAEKAVQDLKPCSMAFVETTPQPSGVVRRRVRFGDAGRFSFFFGFELEPDGTARAAGLLNLALRGLCAGPEVTVRHPVFGEDARWQPCRRSLPAVPPDTFFENGRDPLIQGVFFRGIDGGPLGSIGRWAAHPVTANAFGSRGPAGHGADYPLYVRRRLEREFGGGAVFLTGPCGDQAPLVAEKSKELAERTGSRVAGTLLSALGQASWDRPDRVDAQSLSVSLPMRVDYPKSVEQARDLLAAARGRLLAARSNGESIRALKALSEEIERLRYTVDGHHYSWCGIPTEDLARGSVTHPLSCLRIGDVLITGLPGEPFGGFSVAARERVRHEAPSAHVIVAEECNGYLSYIPTADEYPEGGYGSAAAILAPEAEAVLLEATETLARRCLS